MTEKPSFRDPEAPIECFVDHDNQIHVTLPSDVWINADQAERFGQGLLKCAKWLRENSPPR